MAHNLKFTEDCADDEIPNELEIWQTKKNQLYLQIGDNDYDNPMGTESILLDLEDARVLLSELERIVKLMEREAKVFQQEDKTPRKLLSAQTPVFPTEARANGTTGAIPHKPFQWVEGK